MRYYDDLLIEQMLVLADVEAQILSMNSALAVQVVSEPYNHYGWKLYPNSVRQTFTSDTPLLYVPELGISLSLNSALQLISSYKAIPAFDPITDLSPSPITDEAAGVITDLATATDIELIRDRGINVLTAVQRILSTITDPGVFGAQLLAVNDAINQMFSYVDEWYDPVLDEDWDPISDLTGDAITSLLVMSKLRLSIDFAFVMNGAIQQALGTKPLLNIDANLLANNAKQLVLSTKVEYAAAVLMAISDALQQQKSSIITDATIAHSLVLSTPLQKQIVDAITSTMVHNLLADTSTSQILSDTAYLAGAMSVLINESLQTITSDTLTTRFVANLLADDTLQQQTIPTVLCHAAYALILNTAKQLTLSDRAIPLLDLREFLLTVDDALGQITTISPTLLGLMTLLINDSEHLILTDDISIVPQFLINLSDGLQRLDASSINFTEELLLVIQNALQTQTTISPRLTTEELVVLVRDILARGYYFFKARTKTKR